ncbi:MAG: hypothetical protein Q4A10_07715 [Aerococcaceae bacterium]|nr:hypothetical protein [Aerococcaceae bacterium]
MSEVIVHDMIRRADVSEKRLAQQMNEDVNTVKMWMQGEQAPTIEQLTRLVSILSTHDKHTFNVPTSRKSVTPIKVIAFLFFWLVLTLLLTGFGYQPLWLGVAIYIVGAATTFSLVFDTCIEFSDDYMLVKAKKLPNQLTKVHYQDVQYAQLKYVGRQRYSPFDINPDSVFLDIYTQSGEPLRVDVSDMTNQQLKEMLMFLIYKQVTIKESEQVLSALLLNKSLYELAH